MDPKEVAELIVTGYNVPTNTTVKEYLKLLTSAFWEQEEAYLDKPPFGNRGWKWDIYTTLVKNEVINGKLDKDGNLIECDKKSRTDADKNINDVVNIFETSGTSGTSGASGMSIPRG